MARRAALAALAALAAASALPAAAGPAWSPNFEHLGAWTGDNLEASPLFYRGALLLMMSQMGEFPPGGAHSFFCVFDGATGERLSCPASSSGHAFCSAIVQPADSAASPPINETIWVFCSAWDRANSTECARPGWGCGACADPAGGCYVGAWSCSAGRVADCEWAFTRALTLPGTATVPNVGVGLVPRDAPAAGDLPRHQAFMALESAFPLAVNVGRDGNLAESWILLDPATHSIDGVSNAGLCPFARYDPVGRMYYVGGGGEHVNLARSANLSAGSWQAPPAGAAIARGCTDLAEDCAPGSGVARIAPGFWTNFWANESDHGRRAFLQNLTEWNWSVNDADVCDNGTHTFFLYGQCAQTAPKGWSGLAGNFYQVGLFEGNVTAWLSSYYEG